MFDNLHHVMKIERACPQQGDFIESYYSLFNCYHADYYILSLSYSLLYVIILWY